ncbi:hypothetical protein [Methylomonas sp. 11b]|uniref:hypothetical protein n=1 Tax=Methylomonas sp. 11b TaxID=1168169 RepID=UPI00047BA06C|nr:hypothetical protein [Methylomonas sp. 11b]
MNTITYETSSDILKEFVKQEKIVLESARIGLPSVVGFIVGFDYKGSWWSLPKSSIIYNSLQTLREWDRILVCTLLKGKITFVYDDVWPYLIRLSNELPPDALSKIEEIHSVNGSHKKTTCEINCWASKELLDASNSISRTEAIDKLYLYIPNAERILHEIHVL